MCLHLQVTRLNRSAFICMAYVCVCVSVYSAQSRRKIVWELKIPGVTHSPIRNKRFIHDRRDYRLDTSFIPFGLEGSATNTVSGVCVIAFLVKRGCL